MKRSLLLGALFGVATAVACGGSGDDDGRSGGGDGDSPGDGDDGTLGDGDSATGGSSSRPEGTEGGPCYGNATCDTGLTCASNLCVSLVSGTGGTSTVGDGDGDGDRDCDQELGQCHEDVSPSSGDCFQQYPNPSDSCIEFVDHMNCRNLNTRGFADCAVDYAECLGLSSEGAYCNAECDEAYVVCVEPIKVECPQQALLDCQTANIDCRTACL